MHSNWMSAARSTIADIDKTLPPDADLATRKRALRAAAGGFHCGTSWGRRIWSRAAREYLERHGLAPRVPLDLVNVPSRQGARLRAGLESGDIEFPFREG